MNNRLTESAIEDFAIRLFERLGYDCIHAPDITPDGDRPERSLYDEVLLTGRLTNVTSVVFFSTIQKFQPQDGNMCEQLPARKNIVLIADELSW